MQAILCIRTVSTYHHFSVRYFTSPSSTSPKGSALGSVLRRRKAEPPDDRRFAAAASASTSGWPAPSFRVTSSKGSACFSASGPKGSVDARRVGDREAICCESTDQVCEWLSSTRTDSMRQASTGGNFLKRLKRSARTQCCVKSADRSPRAENLEYGIHGI